MNNFHFRKKKLFFISNEKKWNTKKVSVKTDLEISYVRSQRLVKLSNLENVQIEIGRNLGILGRVFLQKLERNFFPETSLFLLILYRSKSTNYSFTVFYFFTALLWLLTWIAYFNVELEKSQKLRYLLNKELLDISKSNSQSNFTSHKISISSLLLFDLKLRWLMWSNK